MARLGADEIGQEKRVEHDALADHHIEPKDGTGVLELEEGQQVHALILGLLQKGVDPTVIPRIFSGRREWRGG